MGLTQLLLQSLLMAAGTFAVGFVPLTFAKHKTSLNTSGVSIFSVGLLISTALSVVIPEGVSVVLRSVESGTEGEREGEVHEHLDDSAGPDIGPWVGGALCAGFLLMFCIHQYAGAHDHIDKQYKGYALTQNETSTPKDLENGSRIRSASYSEEDGLQTGGSSLISQPGDYFSVASSSSSKTIKPRIRQNSESESADPLDPASPAFSTFIGLLFHALADGISLGAASSFATSAISSSPTNGTGNSVGHEDDSTHGLSFLIFLSLIIHKGPVAFSLSSLLMSYSPSVSLRAHKAHTQRALAVFSLATPIGALVTWVLLKTLYVVSWSESLKEGAEEDGNIEGAMGMRGRLEFWTGMALLFSAGTFLFVSTHVMADMESSSPPHGVQAQTPGAMAHGDELPEHLGGSAPVMKSRTRVALFVAGMMAPLLLSTVMGGHRH